LSRSRAPRAAALRRPGRLALALLGALALGAALALAGVVPGAGRTPRAAAQASGSSALPQTDASVPARGVTLIGATPEEPGSPGAGETWGVGKEGSSAVLVRYTSAGGWTLGPALPGGFQLLTSQLAGAMTPTGSGVLAGTVTASGKTHEAVLVRKSGGAFEETLQVPSEGGTALLSKGETLFAANRAPMIAALDESGGNPGALVVPVGASSAVESQVLRWSGGEWTSEPIVLPAATKEEFRVLAIGATSPTNAWLLGALRSGGPYPPGTVALFRRVQEGGGKWVWKPVQQGSGAGDGEAHPLAVPLSGGGTAAFTVPGLGEPPTVKAQLLTVGAEGVWVDGELVNVHTVSAPSATLFFKPEGTAGGTVQASWCPVAAAACVHALPESLPAAYTRSFAWGGGGPYGQRVITGLPEGESLRLEGETFTPVLSIGGAEGPEGDPGAAYGAAFSSPTEGWLGLDSIPVHITTSPAPSLLKPWPVPFRHPLLAIAPQPGAPVGSLTSEALAVGERGAVARYKPGQGWLPESLFGPGERVESPRLRAVAWPTPARAYAVGDEGAMWLWRGETNLWERDQATPLNFRGDLLGVAFDPNNPARGYAVGSTETGLGGVLLRYGKSWTPETELPPQVSGAALVAIAFAGSEAIVAYREQVGEGHFVGGLIVNEGSGWHVDTEAAAAMGSAVPVAVAGLSDGGAAFVTLGNEGMRLYERERPGAPWAATATPVPGSPRSLSLFREGGALRAIVAFGGGASGNQLELQRPPPGAPPTFHEPLSPGGGSESGDALRQTATGWSDLDHELNPVGAPAGGYVSEDAPYRPDPILAVLADPAGGEGWVVGGEISSEELLQTATVERYGEGAEPPGIARTAVPVSSEYATFAFGGHAECAAPCAGRALVGVGPQVSLNAAVALAGGIGARGFFYTGPSVTEGRVGGRRTLPIPFAQEIGQTASILASSSVPAFAVPATPDLDARPEREGTESTFASAFGGFPQNALVTGNQSPAGCAATVGCQGEYYAYPSTGLGGDVRVIVLDESSTEISTRQLSWLEGELGAAKAAREPAIAVGSSDLEALRANDPSAAELVRVLVTGNRGAATCSSECASASAYFYDSPQENVDRPLRSGSETIPSFGSGTLGYVELVDEERGNFHGASGILLGQVLASSRNPYNDRAQVSARLVPVIGELALEARQGTLLRRSQVALFDGLARRPREGCRSSSARNGFCETDPYIPIPSICVGECSTALLPEYTFTSSKPSVGNFVQPNTGSAESLAVLQNANGEPIPDPQSGLFCAFNKGTTIVTISAGGLSASLPVTVQPGSVRQPCGTVKAEQSSAVQQAPAPPPPAPAPSPAGPAPASSPPPVVPLPSVPLAPVVPAPPPRAVVPPPFIPLAALPAPLLPFVPLPVPTPARPTPPSGTSAVTSPVEAAEKEEEEEEATESVSNQAVAYRPAEQQPTPLYVLGAIVLAAFAGASVRRRPRGRRRDAQIAPATVSTAWRQREMTARSRRERWRS